MHNICLLRLGKDRENRSSCRVGHFHAGVAGLCRLSFNLSVAYSTEYIYGGRGEMGGGGVSALAAVAYTTTLLVMVDKVKVGGRAPDSFYHHDGMYA
jgi:hypothetical protein